MTECAWEAAGSVSLCCTLQSSPAPQEASEQPASPTSSSGGCQRSLTQEAPTASQGLLQLFRRNAPVEDLGAKGVSSERAPRPCRPTRGGLRPPQATSVLWAQASAGRPVCLLPEGGAGLSAA